MIIRERNNEFIMFTQHDHAFISGEIAKQFKKEFFVENSYIEDVLLAVYEHDRSWIGMDKTPIWNDRDNQPFSFKDYPLLPKLLFYKKGLDEIQEMNRYACLLCSLHYSSFFINSTQDECRNFLQKERERQTRIIEELVCKDNVLEVHFKLLQLCDDLSLYICLNEPGVKKEKEHPWYKAGFANSEIFNFHGNTPLVANWLDNRKIAVEGSPFKEQQFNISIRFKAVSKDQVQKSGVERAYKENQWIQEEVTFVSNL